MKVIQDLIASHQALIGKSPLTMNSEDTIKYVNDMVLALQVELVEMLQELPWKPWKPAHSQVCDIKKALEELDDVFIFAFNIRNMLEPRLKEPSSLEEGIARKIQTNIDRLRSGFHSQHK